MNKTCPFGYSNTIVDCHEKCVMYEDGCLFKKALKCYIKEHESLNIPSVDDYRYLQGALTKRPLMYLHPDLQDREDQSHLPL